MGTGVAWRELPARLEGMRRRFERWRRTRRRGARIPEALWASAVKAAGRYGIHRTARVLSVDYYALKRRVEGKPAVREQATRKQIGKGRAARDRALKSRAKGQSLVTIPTASMGTPGAAFLELPPPAWSGYGECSVELEGPSGAKMRVHLKGFPMPDLAALSRSFWKPEA